MSLRGRIALILSALTLVFSLSLPAAYAQTQPDAAKTGSGLSISPTRYDLQINPGKSDVVKVTLRNISGTDIVAKVVVNDFQANGETGEPQIITNTSKQSAQTIRSFLVGADDIPLKKDESKSFEIQVKVPANAAPGAYYGIIRYEAVPQNQFDNSNDSSNVSLTASVGVVVLLTVPGNIKQQVQVLSLNTYKATTSKNSSSFFVSAPGAEGITIKNLGNGFATPFGAVVVTNMFGKKAYTYQLNSGDPRGVILPNSTRNFKDQLKNIKLPGRYTVTANVSYGSGGDIIISKGTFWYLPVWLIVILVVLLALLIAAGYILYRRLSRRPAKMRRK